MSTRTYNSATAGFDHNDSSSYVGSSSCVGRPFKFPKSTISYVSPNPSAISLMRHVSVSELIRMQQQQQQQQQAAATNQHGSHVQNLVQQFQRPMTSQPTQQQQAVHAATNRIVLLMGAGSVNPVGTTTPPLNCASGFHSATHVIGHQYNGGVNGFIGPPLNAASIGSQRNHQPQQPLMSVRAKTPLRQNMSPTPDSAASTTFATRRPPSRGRNQTDLVETDQGSKYTAAVQQPLQSSRTMVVAGNVDSDVSDFETKAKENSPPTVSNEGIPGALPDFGLRDGKGSQAPLPATAQSSVQRTQIQSNRRPRTPSVNKVNQPQQQSPTYEETAVDGHVSLRNKHSRRNDEEQSKKDERRRRLREKREMVQSNLLMQKTGVKRDDGGAAYDVDDYYGGFDDDFDSLEDFKTALMNDESDDWEPERQQCLRRDNTLISRRQGSSGGSRQNPEDKLPIMGGLWRKGNRFLCSMEDRLMLGLSPEESLDAETAAELFEFERFLKRNRETLFRIFLSIKEEERRRREWVRRRRQQEHRELTRQLSAHLSNNDIESVSGGPRRQGHPSRSNYDSESWYSIPPPEYPAGAANNVPSSAQQPRYPRQMTPSRRHSGQMSKDSNDDTASYRSQPARLSSNPEDLLPKKISVEQRENMSVRDLAEINARNLALVSNGSAISELLKQQPTDYLLNLEKTYKNGGEANKSNNNKRSDVQSNALELPPPSMPLPPSGTMTSVQAQGSQGATKSERPVPQNLVIRTLTLVSSEKETESRLVNVLKVFDSPAVYLIPQMFSAIEINEVMRFADSPETLKLYSCEAFPLLYEVRKGQRNEVLSSSKQSPAMMALVLLCPDHPALSCLSRVIASEALSQFFRGLRQRCAAFCKASAESCKCLWIERVEPGCAAREANPGPLLRDDGVLQVTVFLNEGDDLGGLDSLTLGFRVKPEAGTSIYTSVDDVDTFQTLPPKENKKGSDPTCLYLLKCIFTSTVAVTPKTTPL